MALPLLLIFAGIIGLLVGSFLAVVVLRFPKRQPIVLARSACPACGRVLGPSELIPVVSWIAQKRRCWTCKNEISAFYPVMEIASAIIAMIAVWLVSWPGFVAIWIAGWIALCVLALWLRERLFAKSR